MRLSPLFAWRCWQLVSGVVPVVAWIVYGWVACALSVPVLMFIGAYSLFQGWLKPPMMMTEEGHA
jgi:hypothetical protein